jgi:hypothetical protein
VKGELETLLSGYYMKMIDQLYHRRLSLKGSGWQREKFHPTINQTINNVQNEKSALSCTEIIRVLTKYTVL